MASDKARFYMEQAVPQLREFEEKKIFSKVRNHRLSHTHTSRIALTKRQEEIRNLVKKRSDFEHLCMGRGAPAVVFARYATWEINLEALRAARCKRMNIKGSSSHAGQARVFSTFNRGTRKHPGDLGLWMSYLEYCRSTKALKKFKQVLTSALRLHCTNPGLWLYAAKFSLEDESDIGAARSYMQRGARFCNRGPELWIQYAKLEMIFLNKIAARRRILGLDKPAAPAKKAIEESEDTEMGGAFGDEDEIKFPEFKPQAMNEDAMEGVKVDSEASVPNPMDTPALNGAIPMAIFNDATKQPFYTPAAAEQFFDMFSAFTNVHCQAKVVQHVLDAMKERFPQAAETWSCFVRQPLTGVSPLTAAYPPALTAALGRLKEAKENVKDQKALATKTRAWIEKTLAVEGLDQGIKTVLQFTEKKLE